MKQISLVIIFFSTVFVSSAQDQKRVSTFNLEKGIAIQGYDAVAYFSGKAIKGESSLAVIHQGIRYHFSSTANKEEFKKNPGKYEPQYGGWCAYAMGATGEKVEIDPETFKVLNGKLYLFYNKRFNNTLKTWNKDEQALKAKADANWSKLSH
ncbi:YHS domain-containing (seleno)protein [Lacibacter sediminis]|uniref:YHS domain protein n=1 Tax=Lacibacter sediminis TaxID=2760713 RepID=A0A7G5XDP1_9BACT|nr:YHS domain-containing (seleno)protein [Lacibacter sediminis]QNA43594.1 YHS domain protein [Lacibacter sediminis]